MKIIYSAFLFSSFALGLSACGAEPAERLENETNAPRIDNQARAFESAMAQFDAASIIGKPKLVDCTLSGGAKTQCLSLTLATSPQSFEIGPWCPRHIDDGPDVSGIWLDNGKVYDADGAFIQNMSTFYADDTWQIFDPETGKINVTDSKVSCDAAARPDVDPEYQNHCVECLISYMDEDVSQTYIIPLEPVAAQTINPRVDRVGVGVAFSGVRLDASAPVDAILNAHTLAPFDDCGGHINLNVGYHMHAVTQDCLKEISVGDLHAPKIGLAMDGYPIHTRLNLSGAEPSDLDQCRGHDAAGLGYHYHAAEPGSNAIINCHSGQTGCALTDADSPCDASQSVRRGPPPGNGGDRPPRPEQ